jgi:hypothetical protein
MWLQQYWKTTGKSLHVPKVYYTPDASHEEIEKIKFDDYIEAAGMKYYRSEKIPYDKGQM